jgi:hypothetical protein
MPPRYHYKVFCTTENEFKDVYAEKAPTVCPNDYRHPIDNNLTQQLNLVPDESKPQDVIIKNTYIDTQGNYRLEGYNWSAAANTTSDYIISWPYSVSIMSVYVYVNETQMGDIINGVVILPFPIGAITSNVTNGDTVISVTPTVITYMNIGYEAIITDGVNTEILGEVIAKDVDNYTITVTNAPTFDYSATSPTYISMQIKVAKNIVLNNVGQLAVGSAKTGGSSLPANTPIHIYYTNSSPTDAKNVTLCLEYLY